MDIISRIPDDILGHILSFLPTKYAVCTSVLSKRWISVYTFVPIIDIDDSGPRNGDFNPNLSLAFANFVDKVVYQNQSRKLLKFRLGFEKCTSELFSRVNEWVQTVVNRNAVEIDLSVSFGEPPSYKEFLNIPPSESLEVLKIGNGLFFLQMPTTFGCFPNLRVFQVMLAPRGRDVDEDIMKNLFTSLPKLEKLFLRVFVCEHLEPLTINIGGPCLKNLLVNLRDREGNPVVKIDAPQLEKLALKDHYVSSYLVKRLPSLREVQLELGDSFDVSHSDHLLDLVPSISLATSLAISASTAKALVATYVNGLPVFQYLTKLDLILCTSQWYLIMHWLQRCPNLISLVLTEEICSNEEDFIDWSEEKPIPTCLVFHLKQVLLRGLEEGRRTKIVNYLLENANVLETIQLDPRA